MAWAKSEVDPTNALLPGRVALWRSGYPDSQERWIKDMAPFYELTGEYELGDKTNTLLVLRFDLNEARKNDLPENIPSVFIVEVPHAGKSKD